MLTASPKRIFTVANHFDRSNSSSKSIHHSFWLLLKSMVDKIICFWSHCIFVLPNVYLREKWEYRSLLRCSVASTFLNIKVNHDAYLQQRFWFDYSKMIYIRHSTNSIVMQLLQLNQVKSIQISHNVHSHWILYQITDTKLISCSNYFVFLVIYLFQMKTFFPPMFICDDNIIISKDDIVVYQFSNFCIPIFFLTYTKCWSMYAFGTHNGDQELERDHTPKKYIQKQWDRNRGNDFRLPNKRKSL